MNSEGSDRFGGAGLGSMPGSMPFSFMEDDVLTQEAKDMQDMIMALKNEKNAPEILQFQHELISRLTQGLEKQETMVEQLKDTQRELERFTFWHEIRRVRYMLKEYYRVRLSKLESMAALILDTPELHARLSGPELQHVQDYFVVVGSHLKQSVLDHLPHDFQSLVKESELSENPKDMLPQLRLDTRVFCRTLTEVGPVDTDDVTLDMHKDELYFLKYSAVKELVYDGKVVLV